MQSVGFVGLKTAAANRRPMQSRKVTGALERVLLFFTLCVHGVILRLIFADASTVFAAPYSLARK